MLLRFEMAKNYPWRPKQRTRTDKPRSKSILKLRRAWDPEGSSLTYRYSLRPVNCALRLDPPDEMVVVVGEPDRAVVEVNRVAAAAVPLRDDAVRACVDLRQRNAD